MFVPSLEFCGEYVRLGTTIAATFILFLRQHLLLHDLRFKQSVGER